MKLKEMEEMEEINAMELFKEKLDKLCRKTGVHLIGVFGCDTHSAMYVNGKYSIEDVKAVAHLVLDQSFDLVQERTIAALLRKEK